jgi:hypothetical protein
VVGIKERCEGDYPEVIGAEVALEMWLQRLALREAPGLTVKDRAMRNTGVSFPTMKSLHQVHCRLKVLTVADKYERSPSRPRTSNLSKAKEIHIASYGRNRITRMTDLQCEIRPQNAHANGRLRDRLRRIQFPKARDRSCFADRGTNFPGSQARFQGFREGLYGQSSRTASAHRPKAAGPPG